MIGIFVGLVLSASGTMMVEQGRGNTGYSPWRVTDQACGSPVETNVSVSGSATAVPASQTTGRRFIILQNKHGTALVTCRIDGTNPTTATTSPGLRMNPGDTLTYFIPSTVIPKCISDTSSTPISVTECL